MGIIGGGIWKIEDVGQSWDNCLDGFFNIGFIGVIVVVFFDYNIIYVGIGEYLVWGVMISVGDGVYKLQDGGCFW